MATLARFCDAPPLTGGGEAISRGGDVATVLRQACNREMTAGFAIVVTGHTPAQASQKRGLRQDASGVVVRKEGWARVTG